MKKLLVLLTFFAFAGLPAHGAEVRQYITVGPGVQPTLTPPNSAYVNDYALSANTAVTVTWPTGTKYANISASSPVWVNATTTATVPATTITNGSGSALNPAQRRKWLTNGATETFSIISATAQEISIEFWGE